MVRPIITWIAVWLTLAAPLPLFAQIKGTGDGGGGGTTQKLQFGAFAQFLKDLLEGMTKVKTIDLSNIDFNKFEQKIEETKITFTHEQLYVDGEEVEAKNYPKRKPPEILVNIERWNAVAEGSRRAAILFHEYLGIMEVDDSKNQISKKLYEHPTLKWMLNNLEIALPPDQGRELPLLLNCELYENDRLVPYALGRLGSWSNKNGTEHEGVSSMSQDITRGKNRLRIHVDSGADLFGGRPFQSKVKSPAIRITIGYGATGFGPPRGPILAQMDFRVTPDFDAVVSAPSEGVTVHCKRVLRDNVPAKNCVDCVPKPEGAIPAKTENQLREILFLGR